MIVTVHSKYRCRRGRGGRSSNESSCGVEGDEGNRDDENAGLPKRSQIQRAAGAYPRATLCLRTQR